MGHERSCTICEGHTLDVGLLRRKLSKRRWVAQAKVDGVTLRAALQYGGNRCIKNIPLGVPGHITLCVVLPPACGDVDGDLYFACMYVGAAFGDCGRHNMNG